MRVLIWIVLVLTVAAIVVGSLIPGMTHWPPGMPSGISHFLAYVLTGALMALALGTSLRGFLLAFMLTVALGTGVELLQMAVPVRAFSFYDLGMNLAGAGGGVVVGGGVARGVRWFRVKGVTPKGGSVFSFQQE